MSKFQEDEIYSIHVELGNNTELKEQFNKELRNIDSVVTHKYSDIIDKYRYSLKQAKKVINQ